MFGVDDNKDDKCSKIKIKISWQEKIYNIF